MHALPGRHSVLVAHALAARRARGSRLPRGGGADCPASRAAEGREAHARRVRTGDRLVRSRSACGGAVGRAEFRLARDDLVGGNGHCHGVRSRVAVAHRPHGRCAGAAARGARSARARRVVGTADSLGTGHGPRARGHLDSDVRGAESRRTAGAHARVAGTPDPHQASRWAAEDPGRARHPGTLAVPAGGGSASSSSA